MPANAMSYLYSPVSKPLSQMRGICQQTGFFEDSGLELWRLIGMLLHFVFVA